MDINYQLNVNELDINFINSIKQLFKDREIVIHISDSKDTAYLSQITGMMDSIREGVGEDVSECSSLEDIGWE